MDKSIKVVLKRNKKTISEKDVELKELTIDEECDKDDIIVEHYNQLLSKDQFKGIHKRALKLIRVWTDLTDEELKKWTKDERMELFRILVFEIDQKKK